MDEEFEVYDKITEKQKEQEVKHATKRQAGNLYMMAVPRIYSSYLSEIE